MASADRKVTINISTKGDPRGAQDVAKAIEQISNSEKKIGVQNQAFYDLDAALRKTNSSAKQVAQSTAQADAQRATAIQTLRQLAAAEREVEVARGNSAKGFRNVGQSVAQAGLQIQDFTVQVGAGTSALTALAQQGSQFLGIFGPGGAIAGALLALGAIALKAFTEMGDSAEEAKSRAEALAQQLMDTADAAGSEKFQNFVDAMDDLATAQLTVYDGLVGQNDALRDQQKAQDEIAKGWRKAQEAAFEYLAATDPNFDANAAKQGLDSQGRAADRDSAIRQEEAALEKARDVYNKIFVERQAVLDREQQLLTERARLEAQQASIGSDLNRKRDIAGDTGYGASAIQALEADLREVEKNLEGINQEITEKVPRALAAVDAKGHQMSVELQKVIDQTTTNIEQINEQYNAEESTARAKAATDKVKQGVESLKTFVDDFDAITPVQQQAEDAIRAAIQDGKLTADEMLIVSNNLKLLQGTLKTGQQSNAENIQSLINLSAQLLTIAEAQKTQLQSLMEKANTFATGKNY